MKRFTGTFLIVLAAVASIATGGSTDTDPCEGVQCGPGQVCDLVEVQCVTEPCDPLPTCVSDGSGPGYQICLNTAECDVDLVCDTTNYCESTCPANDPGCIGPTVCYGRCVPADGT